MSAPPPPPPHGESPKSSGLPDGKYDIFIIPPHSAGSGFLYLPSLRPNANSFAAGFASALLVVVIGQAVAPAFQAWWQSVKGAGGMGMMLVIIAVALGAWALGRTQTDGGSESSGGPPPQPPPHSGVPPPQGGAYQGGQQHQSNGYANGTGPMPGGNTGPPPKTWQRTNPPPGATGATGASSAGANTANGAAKGAWEKAREETKRKEEERKAKEAERKRKEELDKKLKEARERDAREREAREKVVREREAQVKEKLEKENLQKEIERLKRERELREKLAKEAKEKQEDKENEVKSKGSTYAYSSVGEKTNPWPRGQPAAARPQPSSQPSSPTKRPPAPSARTYLGTEDEQYSYRPYDKPKKPAHSKSSSSIYSESSYAASQSTYATTAPPSNREPYTTKDPDKIVIKAVYAFNNNFLKTPTSQLVSGVGSVTDGLILRITTEGLFIDDDVRGVPQREWDVKAWTMKLVEVWCPCFRQGPSGQFPASSASASAKSPLRRLWGLDKDKPASSEETDALLNSMLHLCKNTCRLSASSASASDNDRRSSASDSAYGSSVGTNDYQTGELKSAHLHILRASIRDQDGKRYVFVIQEEESWKVAVGLQRLRKGAQVKALGATRALAVSGMSSADARHTLENLGWG